VPDELGGYTVMRGYNLEQLELFDFDYSEDKWRYYNESA